MALEHVEDRNRVMKGVNPDTTQFLKDWLATGQENGFSGNAQVGVVMNYITHLFFILIFLFHRDTKLLLTPLMSRPLHGIINHNVPRCTDLFLSSLKVFSDH